jgi:dTDP-glucose pyrophosphorylase
MVTIEPNWRRALVPLESNIEQAVRVLNEVGYKIVIVTDPTGILLGTVSDGDIRRGLLRGLDLSSPLDGVIHREVLVAPPELGRDLIIKLMTVNKIQQIPIVDKEMRVIGLYLWDEIVMQPIRPNMMVIMAGGKGTRLHPQTENCPKPLLPVAGKPILEHIINSAKAQGISSFVLAIHHLGHMIEEHFGDGSSLGVSIEYTRENSPLGTAGAISLLNPLPDSAFVVTNGDVLTDTRYGELIDFHQQNSAQATMAVRIHEWQNPFGVVQTDGFELTSYEEKPIVRSLINAGVYVIEPSAVRHLVKSAPCDMPSFFEKIQVSGDKVIVFPIHERWLDIGRPSELIAARIQGQERK